jgi:hypothetical protein
MAVAAGCGSAASAGTPAASRAVSATRATPPTAVLAGRYVAMGSSFASGSGVGPDIGAGCQRTAANYPHLVARQFGLDLVDRTCAGATVANLLDTPQDGRPPQLDAVTLNTRLVTITVGGNDVDYSASIERCMRAARAGQQCTGIPSAVEQAKAAVTLRDGLVALVGRIRANAPDAAIYLLGYPRIFPEPAASCDNNVISPLDTARLTTMGRVLDATLRLAASQTSATFVDVYTASVGRDVCAPVVSRWLNGSVPLGIVYHPNAQGVTGVARLLADILSRHFAPAPGVSGKPVAATKE